MALALGLVANITTILDLVSEISTSGYNYVSRVSQASNSFPELTQELQSLAFFLDKIQNLVDKNPGLEALQSLNDSQNGSLHGCAQDLKELQSKLEPRDGLKRAGDGGDNSWLKRAIGHFKQPLRKKETLRLIHKIERHKRLLTVALVQDQILLRKNLKTHIQSTNHVIETLQERAFL